MEKPLAYFCYTWMQFGQPTLETQAYWIHIELLGLIYFKTVFNMDKLYSWKKLTGIYVQIKLVVYIIT